MTVSGIVLPDVVGRIKAAVQADIKINQPMSNYASRIGHPCERYLTYSRLDWDKVPPITPEKKMLFELGYVFERNVAKQYLERAGFDIVEMDRPVQSEASGMLKRVKLHGKLDFIARDRTDGFEFPVEVKSASPHSWEAIDTIEDMLMAKRHWLRQYPAQLMVYLLGKNYEVGLMLLINKVTGEPKAVWIHQDYTYAEELVQKAERVNAHVEAKTYPERIPYDDNICGSCDFAVHCLKEVMRTEADILGDPLIIERLEERELLKKPHKRYEELDNSLKSQLKNLGPKVVAGDFMIVNQKRHRDAYAVAPNDYVQTSIKKLEGAK